MQVMPTPQELKDIQKYAKEHGIECSESTPKTFTSSVKGDVPHRIVLKINDASQLPPLMKEINRINAESKDPVCTSVIGGGRGGTNNSYSIGHIFDGTDVFIQIVTPPTLKEIHIKDHKEEFKEDKESKMPKDDFEEKESKRAPTTEKKSEVAIFRISPNMMLVELNEQLFAAGYHCPTLCGGLPFMSLGGGLSTGSHTSVGYLADIVVGIRLLLPNGTYKYFTKEDPDFDLICNQPTLGLLGVITAIDIKVNPGRKKLQTTTALLTYENFMAEIEKDIQRGQTLDFRGLIFSAYDLQGKTPVKMTRWDWVEGTTPDVGTPAVAIADSSFFSSRVVPKIATTSPKLVSYFFNREKITPAHSGKIVAEPHKIMGPESQLVGTLTEVGVFFDYDASKMKEVLKRLEEILKSKGAQNKFPVNTAIFIRFPKSGAGHKVAIDFASLGLDLPEMLPFINEFVSYLRTLSLHPQTHFGKNHAIQISQSDSSSNGWEQLKAKYSAFYKKHDLTKVRSIKKLPV